MTKTLDTLAFDVDKLFFDGKIIAEESLIAFGAKIANILKESIAPRDRDKPECIRPSKMGLPDRKLWFEHNLKQEAKQSSNALKFIYGHLVEALIIFLAQEAGHLVEDEQKEIEIDGIKGHQDCRMDGITVDVKSASSYAFRKFSERTLFRDDPFGYVAQLSAYAYADRNNQAAFIGVNKENGQICILPLQQIDRIDPVQRIAQVRKVVAMKEPPLKKCYEAVPYKTSDNLTLSKNCTYCIFKEPCWANANNGKGLRWFNYANSPVAMTEVIDLPRVEELFLKDHVVTETHDILEA
jgi:hypothetical protein